MLAAPEKPTGFKRRFVSRQRLCLCGVTDYWVNDVLGQPFLVINKPIDSGLLAALREDIAPRLLADVPNQATADDLKQHPTLPRFGLTFDREGFSQKFFKDMWQNHQIACYTYAKNVKESLPESDFEEHTVLFVNGQTVKMMLSKRGIYHKPTDFRFREIRKLTETGHQTTIFTTDFHHDAPRIDASMFARRSQENFRKYRMQHYAIDRLVDYQLQATDATSKVVNPALRQLDRQIRSRNGTLGRKHIEFADLVMDGELDAKNVEDYMHIKATL